MAPKAFIANVLAQRYASAALVQLWSTKGKILLEREFWIALMKAQQELGLAIPAEAIRAYEKAKSHIYVERIQQREQQTRHDVKARIDEFNELAGYEHIHKGLTSRDLTDNIEQFQILRSLQLVRLKYAACLYQLSLVAQKYQGLILTGRTHNVPAQLTTLGKRLAMFGQEMLLAFERFEVVVKNYPLRGLKGAVGTQLDQLTLFGGDADKVRELEYRLATYLGFQRVLLAVGQVYPRSLDFEVISALFQLGAGVSSFAKTMRLMTGYELVSEGFRKGQVGSSSMPHKMNARSCERLNGLFVLLNGYLNMAMGLAGEQWQEGDVSCSVVRRIVLPDAFFAIDGMLETFLNILNEMEVFPTVIKTELERYLPFLASTTILMEAVKHGAGRETAHAAIKEHALAVVREMHHSGASKNDLLERLAHDNRIPLNRAQLEAILKTRQNFIGEAEQQTQQFVAAVAEIVKALPEAQRIKPEQML